MRASARGAGQLALSMDKTRLKDRFPVSNKNVGTNSLACSKGTEVFERKIYV